MSTTPLKRSFFFNLISPIMRLVVAVVTVPIYIHHVGEARYGVLSIVWILLGYFGFLDLGLSRASTSALSKLRDAPQPDRARVLLTTITLNFDNA
jgi:O-antigen/teichoic acid export membrane protein